MNTVTWASYWVRRSCRTPCAAGTCPCHRTSRNADLQTCRYPCTCCIDQNPALPSVCLHPLRGVVALRYDRTGCIVAVTFLLGVSRHATSLIKGTSLSRVWVNKNLNLKCD